SAGETAMAKRGVLGAVIAAPPAWEQFGWGGHVAAVSFAVKGMVGVVGAAIVVTAAVAVWPPANDADPPSANEAAPIHVAQNDAEPATSSGTNGEAESDTPGSVLDVVGSLVRQERV